MRPIICLMLLAFTTINCWAQEHLPGLHYWRVRQEIEESLQKGDYQTALSLLREADTAVPDDPTIVFRIHHSKLRALCHYFFHTAPCNKKMCSYRRLADGSMDRETSC